MLVPESVKYSRLAVRAGHAQVLEFALNRRLPRAASDTMLTPGATRSGLASRSNRVGPRELESETRSSERSGVPSVSSEPTQIADGALHGTPTPP